MAIWNNNFLSQQILPGFYARRVNKKIDAYSADISEYNVESIAKTQIPIVIDQLKSDIENQSERKKGLEDKVKAILFSISIAITAITFSLGYIKDISGNVFDYIAIAVISLSIYFFIACAIVSVQTLMPIQFNLVQTESIIDNENRKISLSKEHSSEQYKTLLLAKLKNDSSNLKINNLTYASLTLLRNGIILFSSYFVIAVVAKNIPTKFTNKVIVNSKTVIKINDSVSIVLPYSYEGTNDKMPPIMIGTPLIEKKAIVVNMKPKTLPIRKIPSDSLRRHKAPSSY